MPGEEQIFPYVLLVRERQTVVLERHPDHIGGPAHSASTKPIFAIAPPCAIVSFFMRGGALSAHGSLVANGIIESDFLLPSASSELVF